VPQAKKLLDAGVFYPSRRWSALGGVERLLRCEQAILARIVKAWIEATTC